MSNRLLTNNQLIIHFPLVDYLGHVCTKECLKRSAFLDLRALPNCVQKSQSIVHDLKGIKQLIFFY